MPPPGCESGGGSVCLDSLEFAANLLTMSDTITINLDPDQLECYSDHASDIAYYGECSFCGSTDPAVTGHVLPDIERLTNVDPVKASAIVVHTGGAKMFDGVLLDHFSASAVQGIYAKLNPANQAKLRAMSLVKAVDVCFKLINRANGRRPAAAS